MSQAPESVAHLFLDRVASTPEREAFRVPQADGSWKSQSWKDVGVHVRNIACGLRALGLTDEARATILSGTRVEWIIADLGILCATGATTTIYPSNTPDECAFILKDSGSTFVFAEDEKQVKKLRAKRADLPLVKKVITFDKVQSDDDWVISLEQLEKDGAAYDAAHPGEYEKVARSVKKEHLATLIYTSGTTGQPKGVELVHDTWLFQSDGIAALHLLEKDDVQYLWLPLSHVFGKILLTAQLAIGFSTAVDGRVDKIVPNLAVVKPTFVAAVPRIFEKVYNKILGDAKEAGGLKWKIFQWALGVGKQVSAVKQAGGSPTGLLAIKHAIATKLVFSKLQDRFGGRLKYFVSGSAPLNRDIAEFFHAFDILILEGYGLTESSAASFVNRPTKYKFGTVGLPIPGVEFKIAESDGEILLKCRGIMRGYHGLPDATKECIDKDGWFATGDIGEVDADGFLKITDRKKDLIKTSGGKYIAPQLLEGKLKTLSTLISQAVIHGDRRNYCSALVTIEEEAAKKWAAAKGIAGGYAEIVKNDALRAEIQTAIDALNKGLPSYSTVKKFAILPTDFTIESGELTASLKVRRKIVEKKYQAMLDDFYKDALASIRSLVRHTTWLALLALTGCAHVADSDPRTKSPQWRDGRFENPADWPKRLGLGGLLKWQLTPGRPRAPKDYRPPFVRNDGQALRDNHGGVSITWIGHATALLQAGGVSVLTDPIFSDRISGFLKRYAPPGVLAALLPPIDVVVISHNHRDHLDEESVVALGPSITYVVPLGLGRWFKKRGLTKVVELDWWATTEIVSPRGGKALVTLVPAQHWSRRGIADENRSLWGGYVIDAGNRRFYFAGDTGYPAAFKEIGRRFPDLDYALLPIGAYEPRWFMCSQHISPTDAVKVFHEIGAKHLIPVHWGTFHLADEPMDEPPKLLTKALGSDVDKLLQLSIGESFFEPVAEEPIDERVPIIEPAATGE